MGVKKMTYKKKNHSLFAAMCMLLVATAQAQNASPPLVIVADHNKDILQVNFQCDVPSPECPSIVERINENNIKKPDAVALGLTETTSFVFVSNRWGHRREIRLFTQGLPGEFWGENPFASARADAMTVVADSGTDDGLYIADNTWWNSEVRVFLQNNPGCIDPGPLGYCKDSEFVGHVKINGFNCHNIVGLVEFPRASGNLIATCAWPRGAAMLSRSMPSTTLVGPGQLRIKPNGADVVSTSFGDYLLFSTRSKVVLAFDLIAMQMQNARVIRLRSKLRGIATGLCVDNSSCAVVTETGSGGQATLVSLSQSVNGDIVGTVEQRIGQQLSLPGSTAMANQGTVSIGECLTGTCSVGTSQLDLSNVNNALDPDDVLAFQTEGVFMDPHFVSPGVCVTPAVPLPLDFTMIPGLEDVEIDPQHCARNNGFFFIDVIDDGGVEIANGTVEWLTDDQETCYQTGDVVIPDIEDVTYGLWAGDANDIVPSEDMFAEDRLIGCFNPRRRGTDTLSFIIEGFQGHQDFNISDTTGLLQTYGTREINESIDIVENDSACSSSLVLACEENILGWNRALVGWNLQTSAGLMTAVPMTLFTAGGSTDTQNTGLADLRMTLTANGGSLGFKSRDDGTTNWTAIGVTGGPSGNEIDLGQSIEVGVSATPRGTTVSDLPFEVPSFTIALLFDGPEFGDVEEIMRVTATLHDGSMLVGDLQAKFDSMPTWSRVGATLNVLSPMTSSGAAVIEVISPFGNAIVKSLTYEPVAVTGPCNNGGSCTNQSDGSIYDIKIAVVDRVDALALAFQGLLESLCPVSTRVDGRPALCTSGPFVSDFNTIGQGARNFAGRLQVSAESLGRFVGHNICLLDPAFDGGSFCTTPPPWDNSP